MGVSLHIQRVGGEAGDMPSVELSEAIQLFDAIPWRDEIGAWEKIPDEEKEEHRPLLQLFDDQGHMLQISAYSDHMAGVAYIRPSAASAFGVDYEEEFIGTDQFPLSEVPALMGCFFQHHAGKMLLLLERYPMKALTDESREG